MQGIEPRKGIATPGERGGLGVRQGLRCKGLSPVRGLRRRPKSEKHAS